MRSLVVVVKYFEDGAIDVHKRKSLSSLSGVIVELCWRTIHLDLLEDSETALSEICRRVNVAVKLSGDLSDLPNQAFPIETFETGCG